MSRHETVEESGHSRNGDTARARTHPKAVVTAHARVFAGSAAQGRYIEVAPGQRAHIIEAGEGPSLVLLHGSGPTALQFVPLLDRLQGVHAIAVDRPGFGLSDPPDSPPVDREGAVASLTTILDSLGLGATPPPGPPPPMPPPSRETVIQSMAVFGEAETIAHYPDQIDAMVAAGSDEIGLGARLAELRAVISPTGWQPTLTLDVEELRRMPVPTLLIWGERDPLGGATVAHAAAATIPNARLELLPAGHGPWLGHPDRTAELIGDFVH